MVNGMKKISIIVPCYNGSVYIDQCMQTLVEQTIGIENIEIIVIDDASTDDSLDKLSKWEKKYTESILIIHCEQNGKQGCARNIGMTYATAEYIGFVDIDDVVEKNMYEEMYDNAKQYDCDMVICQIQKDRTGKCNSIISDLKSESWFLCIDTTDTKNIFLQLDTNDSACNKIYKRNLLVEHQITFLEGCIYEDIFFSRLVKQYCTKVLILPSALYHHIYHMESTSNNVNKKTERMDFIFVHMMLLEELRKRNLYEKYKAYYENEFIISYFTFMINYKKIYGVMDDGIYQVIRERIVELIPDYKQVPLIQSLSENITENKYQSLIRELDEVSD